MNFTLQVWRQKSPRDRGEFVTYRATGISPDMSFIEMLRTVNEELLEKGEQPIAFEYDCLEGICGTCSLMIDGIAHGPQAGTTACQLHMRHFEDSAHIVIEPWRVSAFPVIRDLVVDRSSFDRIMQAGGFVSVNTGGAPDANSIPIPKTEAETSMDAASCIGCGACAASCKNGSAMLFVAAKAATLGHLPQGKPEQYRRVRLMVETMDQEGFGNCTNQYECEAVCPKEISARFIAELNRDYRKALIRGE